MTAPLWTLAELIASTGGTVDTGEKTGGLAGIPPAGYAAGPGQAAGASITGVSIDTRTLVPGDLFVALVDARDGHEFVGAAFAAGAGAALVVSSYVRRPGDGCLIRVDDPLRALERIGVAARARLSPDARVAAVTGSAGKTGTKEMLRACLAPYGATHAPDKSFNNHWGVPLTLARMPAGTRFGVFEIGMNHAGEIEPLVRMVRPHVAVITNVLPVHVGNFADGEVGVAAAKAEILLGLARDGIAVLPFDNRHFPFLQNTATAIGVKIVAFGHGAGADVHAVALDVGPDRSVVTITIDGRSCLFEVGAPGLHLASNALAVAAVLDQLGLPLAEALKPLADVRPPQGRGARQIFEVDGGRVLLIDESYNANPASVKAALAAMASVPRSDFPRRIVVLGDMLELGVQSQHLHIELKEAIDDAGADLVFAAGAMMHGLFETLRIGQRAAWAQTAAELTPSVVSAVREGDAVMIKGSLGSRMGPVVGALKAKLAAPSGGN